MMNLEKLHPWASKWFATAAVGAALLLGCEGSVTVENLTDYGVDSNVAVVAVEDTATWPAEPPPPAVDSSLLRKLLPCDGFDYPVGPPDGGKYWKARGFLPVGLEHLGEDWNGPGGGNTDFGDYVYACADGVVIFSKYINPGWGNVIRILHNYGTAKSPRYIETVYAHVSSSWVHPGYVMRRGEIIGTIGNAEGKYHAHLHFEMRRQPGKDIRCGYDGDTVGFTDPTPFIDAHRPKR